MENTTFPLKSPLKTIDSKQKRKKPSQSSRLHPFLHAFTSTTTFTSSFSQSSRRTSTIATQIAGAERFRGRKSSRRALCFLLWVVPSFACPNLHHNTHRSRTISKKKSSPELGNKPEPPWATIQRFVVHNFPFSPIWISKWVFRFFICFIGKFQILSIPFLMRTEGGFWYDLGLFGFWIRDVWLIWLS